MSTTVPANEPSRPQDRTRGLAQDKTTAIGLLIAVGLVCLVAGMVYLNTLVSPVQMEDPEVQNLARSLVGP